MKNRILLIVLLVIVLIAAALVYMLFIRQPAPEIRMPYTAGESFVTTIRGSSNRYIKTGIVLYLNTDDEKFVAILDDNKAMIRDTIIFIQMSFDLEYLQNGDNREEIRQVLIDALNERFEFSEEKCIVDLMFTDFVLQ